VRIYILSIGWYITYIRLREGMLSPEGSLGTKARTVKEMMEQDQAVFERMCLQYYYVQQLIFTGLTYALVALAIYFIHGIYWTKSII